MGMTDKFILKHVGKTKGHQLTFNPFNDGVRKAKINAVRIREFLRNHISQTQYEEILRELSKDNKLLIPK